MNIHAKVAGIVAVASIVLLGGCGDGSAPVRAQGTDDQAATTLDGFAGQQPNVVLWSDPISTEAGLVAMIATEDPAPRTAPTEIVGPSTPADEPRDPAAVRESVLVATYTDHWTISDELVLPKGPPSFDFFPDGKVQVGDLTGDHDSDVLLPLLAQGSIGIVVTRHGGRWALGQFESGSGSWPYSGLDPVIADGQLTTWGARCEPNCDAPSTRTTWRFDGTRFLRQG
jgi:hypothetical protein